MLAALSNLTRREISSLPRICFNSKLCYKLYTTSNNATHLDFKATLDGNTLYISQDAAKALGWTESTPLDGVSLRLSGWGPHYFAITQKGTDADSLARATVESSQNPVVQATLEHLKKTDSE
ncbi:hypothetical protein CVT26_003612 [Gymnopilus dilepis]|uniref:Uncharacterized protein n=1 Tax=Gymnopilus dilepis TaxID=231916 RepID=A0A409WR65_9AGAR|nr:hypothetical protein CVT26_003612 [Gymnopilus dilepis]